MVAPHGLRRLATPTFISLFFRTQKQKLTQKAFLINANKRIIFHRSNFSLTTSRVILFQRCIISCYISGKEGSAIARRKLENRDPIGPTGSTNYPAAEVIYSG